MGCSNKYMAEQPHAKFKTLAVIRWSQENVTEGALVDALLQCITIKAVFKLKLRAS